MEDKPRAAREIIIQPAPVLVWINGFNENAGVILLERKVSSKERALLYEWALEPQGTGRDQLLCRPQELKFRWCCCRLRVYH